MARSKKPAPAAPNGGVGSQNAVAYPYAVGTQTYNVLRYLFDVSIPAAHGGLKFSPTNPRLVTILAREKLDPTQENLNDVLTDEAVELVDSLPITGGVTTPIIITADKIVEEGNRRLCAYRHLYNAGDARFRYIPVEELPPQMTRDEIDLLLTIRHVKSPKNWQPREQWRVIERLLASGRYTYEQISTVLEVQDKKDYIKNAILAKSWYDEQDAYTEKQKTKTQVKDPDRLFTYFWKLATKKKFREEFFADKGERDRFYRYVHNGQFNDCLNIDKLSAYWNKKEFTELMEQGVSYKSAKNSIDRGAEERRGSDAPKETRKLRNTLKGLRKADKAVLKIPAGAEWRTELEMLKLQIEMILTETQPNTAAEKSEKPKKDAA